MNDRSLPLLLVLEEARMGYPEDGFNITPASEVMAIFVSFSRIFEDLKNRLGNIFVGFTFDKETPFLPVI
ncbi:MAG: formate--tetrahydrofolate ligase [Saprospiraceae bacterium]